MTTRSPDAPYGESRIVYVVYTNTDLTEGRGWQYPIAVCEAEATAIRLAHKCYVMGTDGPVEPVSLLLHEGKWYAPLSAVRIHPPTEDDRRTQKAMDAKREAIKKAKNAGLTDADLKAIEGNL